jgi:hypothetical protein
MHGSGSVTYSRNVWRNDPRLRIPVIVSATASLAFVLFCHRVSWAPSGLGLYSFPDSRSLNRGKEFGRQMFPNVALRQDVLIRSLDYLLNVGLWVAC